MKKYLLSLLFIVFIAPEIFAGGTFFKLGEGCFVGKKNLLKDVQATFELWDTTPTALNLTDEDFDVSTIGMGNIVNITDTYIGNIIFDLGAIYNNVIVSSKIYLDSNDIGNGIKVSLFYSNDNITYTDVGEDIGLVTFADYQLGLNIYPINCRYIKFRFNVIPSGSTGSVTLRFYEFTANQYK